MDRSWLRSSRRPRQPSKKESFARHAWLVEEIYYHNYLYHQLDAPVISDYEYDMLKAELKKLEETYPELCTPESPSMVAGTENAEKYYLKRINAEK